MTARDNGLADCYDARFVTGAPRHQPGLPDLLNAFLRPELTLEHVEEPGNVPVPHALAFQARRN